MKKFIVILLTAVLFQSCIEITETLTIKKDGSGNIELLVDLGKAGKYLSQGNQKMDMSILETIKKMPQEADLLLKEEKGISNLKTKSDDSKGIYMISFDFKNTKSLNHAFYKLAKQKKSFIAPDFIKVSRHKVKQIDFGPLVKKYLLKDESNTFSDMFYQFITIQSVFVLPAPAKKTDNIKSITENEKNTVRLKYTVSEMLYNDFNYGITIRY